MGEAAIVLCGGRSRRMGRDKWSLPFGGETLLERTVRRVRGAVGEVCVVAREGQQVPAGDYTLARDPAEGLGPLAGLVSGLEATGAERAFLTACDVPFLDPAFVRWLLDRSRGYDLAIPVVEGFHMSTAAVYARSVLPAARRLIGQRRLRPFFLLESVRTLEVDEREVRAVDADLAGFSNCNTPEQYERALRRAGYTPRP